jgi:hypothetical protein
MSTVHVLVRVWLPDRPGALGQVASRIGAVRGDIVAVDVLERGDGVAIDEFAVELADESLLPALVREIEEVDGASVEELRTVEHFPDAHLDALRSAARLCEAHSTDELLVTLTTHVRREFAADWTGLLRGNEVLVANGDSLPSAASLRALALGTAASPAVIEGAAGPEDLAVASLLARQATLLVGRSGRPFRRLERSQLIALVRIADRVWTLLAERRPARATSV